MQDAGNDPIMTRRGTVASLYLHLTTKLDFVDYRRVRAEDVARTLAVHKTTVRQALKILSDFGYIERGARLMDVFTYRLVYARRNGHPKP